MPTNAPKDRPAAPFNPTPSRPKPTNARAAETALTRRRQAIGLLLLAALILLVTLLRSPADTLFPPGWWRF